MVPQNLGEDHKLARRQVFMQFWRKLEEMQIFLTLWPVAKKLGFVRVA
jgi:hypothetical protein